MHFDIGIIEDGRLVEIAEENLSPAEAYAYAAMYESLGGEERAALFISRPQSRLTSARSSAIRQAASRYKG